MSVSAGNHLPETTPSKAGRAQFAACEALLNDGAVDACAAAAETLTRQYPKHARAWCLRAALAPQAEIALKHAERAKALKPDLDCVRTALARALVRSAVEAGKAHSEARISLLERALAEQDDPKTWYRLGRARREAKDLAGAADAFEKCGDDARAKFWAACCRGDPSEDAPIEHLEALYDGYAGRYDAHLSDALRSQAPALVAESVRGAKARKALDCGCGTGLSGRALFDAEACSKLDGVDLSEAMSEKARQTGLYEDVAKGELCPCAGVLHSNEETPNDRNVRRAD